MLDLGFKITIIANKLKRRIDLKVSSLGISAVQGKVLGYIFCESKMRDVFQRDIEEHFNIRSSSVTSLLQSMERNNLITRVSVPADQRLKKLVLTQKAESLQHEIEELINTVNSSAFDCLDEQEQKTLDALSNKIISNIDKF